MILSPEPPTGEELEDERYLSPYPDTSPSTRKPLTSTASSTPASSSPPRDSVSCDKNSTRALSAFAPASCASASMPYPLV